MTLPPDTAALVERLNAYRPTDEWGDGVHHVICTEAAATIEAQARRIEELREGLQTIADADFVDVMCDPGWAIRYSKDTLARANGARDEGEGA